MCCCQIRQRFLGLHKRRNRCKEGQKREGIGVHAHEICRRKLAVQTASNSHLSESVQGRPCVPPAGLLLIAGIVSGALGAHALKTSWIRRARCLPHRVPLPAVHGGAISGRWSKGLAQRWVGWNSVRCSSRGAFFSCSSANIDGSMPWRPGDADRGRLMIAGWGHWVWSLWRGR